MPTPFEQFLGVFTALVTPFNDAGIDFAAYEQLLDRQLAAGIRGLVPVGTTGEAATLDPDEAKSIIRTTVSAVAGRALIMAGTGSNNTAHAIEAARSAEAAGADACLVVTPYYNRPSQEGLLLHYGAVAKAVGIAVMLYSVPGRCGIEIAPETAARLRQGHANIIGIKEAGGRAERITDLRAACGNDFIIHSGDDALTLPFLAAGAHGVTSVVANYAPRQMVDLLAAWQTGDHERALYWHERIHALCKALFVESNPAPVKQALAFRQLMSAHVRAPLAPLSEQNRRILQQALAVFETDAA